MRRQKTPCGGKPHAAANPMRRQTPCGGKPHAAAIPVILAITTPILGISDLWVLESAWFTFCNAKTAENPYTVE